MSSTRNRHLQLRGTTWHIHWNVPTPLRDTPLFRSKAVYAKSLRTRDVHEARKMRDVLVSEFEDMVTAVSAHSARRAFMGDYARAKRASVELNQQLTIDPAAVAPTVQASYEAHLVEQGRYAEAYIEALQSMPDVPTAITLHEATQRFIKAHEGTVDKGVLSRARHATKGLLRVLDADITLADVTPRHVLRWMNAIRDEVSDGTRSGYMSAMQRVWQWAWENEQVDGASPFKGNKTPRRGDAGTYEDFTVDEVKGLIAAASPTLRELMRFGLITGCRLSELVGLSPASFTMSEGVHVIQIFEGKTKAAARSIPLPAAAWYSLKQAVEADLWDGTAQAWSQRFGDVKLKATGKKDRSKGFHSFRHMTATAYERVHMEERIVSVILGHKNKRAESMSYGLYSAGLAPKQYLEAVEKMLAGEYMQSFLVLFKQ